MSVKCVTPHPVSSAEVNSLSEVVALVEAAVVGSGEGHHKLPCTLIGPVHLRRGGTKVRLINNMDHTTNNQIKYQPQAQGHVQGRRAP